MAIRVIKHGTKILHAACPCCNCEFEFTLEDMITIATQKESYETIPCPECGHKLYWWYGEKSGRVRHHATPYN